MKLFYHCFNLFFFNKAKSAFKTLFSISVSALLVLMAAGVYPAYALDSSMLQVLEIIISPDDFPVKPTAERKLTAEQLMELELCNSQSNCSQNAVNNGAVYYKVLDKFDGKYIAYYDANGNLVAITDVDIDDSNDGSLPPSSGDGGNNNLSPIIGSTGGELVITPSGSASYSIPIDIPPSTNGVAPDVSLSYDSQSGNGVMGVGWAIAGIPEITRCGANKAIDGEIKPVALTYDDKFCMGGSRLIAVGDNAVYGADGTEYRTEIDSLQKITSIGTAGSGPAMFELETKSGTIMTFGLDEDGYDSRFEANVYGGIFQLPTVEKWALGKVQDKNNNYYKVAYEEETVANGFFGDLFVGGISSNKIKRIDYTGNSDLSTVPYASVVFEYQPREDVFVYWISGSKTIIKERLSNIKTYVGSALVKDYKLQYKMSATNQLSTLSSVQECSPQVCKNKTRMGTYEQSHDLSSENWGVSHNWGSVSHSYTRVGDFNGDGKDDLFSPDGNLAYIKLSNGDGFDLVRWGVPVNQGYWKKERTWTGDFNGDGKTDIASKEGSDIYMRLSTGSSLTSRTWRVNTPWGKDRNIHIGDFNGDGRTDIASKEGGNTYMYLSTISPFNTSSTFSYSNWPNEGWGKYEYTWTGDFNGDGLTDIASRKKGKIYMHLSTGTSFINKVWPVPDNWGESKFTWTGDFNGDGLTDIATKKGNKLYVYKSTGVSFTSSEQVVPYGWGSSKRTWVGEFNGDGQSDIVSVSDDRDELFVYSPKDQGLVAYKIPVANEWTEKKYSGVADLNGDGVSDIFSTEKHGLNTFVKLSEGGFSNLLSGVVNGFGNATNIGYRHLTDNAIYAKAANSTYYPKVNLQTAKVVVSSKTTTDGLDGTTSTVYKYGGEKNHLGGRGSLGFKWTESTNMDTGLITRAAFAQDFPYIGMTTKETQTLAGYGKISETTKSLSVRNSDKGLKIPYVSNDNTKTYGLNGQLLSITNVASLINELSDIYSTVTTVTDAGGAQYTTTTSNEYGNMGLPKLCDKSQVTRSIIYKTGPQGVSPNVIKDYIYSDCNLIQESGSANGTAGLTKIHTYDGFGHVNNTTISAPDITSRTMTTEYESKGRFIHKVINEHGHQVMTEYDERFGVVTSSIDANGLLSTMQYDNYGSEIESTSPGGIRKVTSRQWLTGYFIPPINASNNSHDVSFSVKEEYFGGSLSNEKFKPDNIAYFDKLGREIRQQTQNIDGRLVYVDTSYDKLGRVITSTQPYFSNAPFDKNPTTTNYDALNRPIKTTSPDGGETTITYDGLNLIYTTKVSDPFNAETTQSKTEIKNVIGQLLEVIDTQGNSLYYEYDVLGNKTKVLMPSLNTAGSLVNAKGTITSFTYDDFGRKTAMNDADMGSWSYLYNSLSELLSQTDANANTTTMLYDKLGRLIKRTDGDGMYSEWIYNDDIASGQTPVSMGIGKLDLTVLKSSTGYETYRSSSTYEPILGLPTETSVTIPGFNNNNPYIAKTSYDSLNRPEIITYPETAPGQSLKVKYAYENGIMNQVQSIDGSIIYWKADILDAQNRVNYSVLGNGANTWQTYDKVGRANLISVADANANIIYEAAYQFDTLGNLREREVSRSNVTTPIVERYNYDNLNRLINSTENSTTILSNSYDILGNIRSKSGVGAYTYGTTSRPHAVASVAGNAYNYDNNGNLISDTQRAITWTPYNKPTLIDKSGENITSIQYGPNRARYYKYDSDVVHQKYSTTTYIGGLFETVESNQQTKYKHYIKAGGATIATYTVATDAPSKLEYMQRDYQGSVAAVSDETGNVKAQLDFDAFGLRKAVAGASAVDPIIEDMQRGYTGHEHLDGVGLIHMNGRVYNPEIGRFLSADPFVQAPTNLQSYNRYSYVLNNPMSYTDPSGYFSLKKSLKKALRGAAKVAVGITGASHISSVGIMYTKPVQRFFLKHAWARTVGSIGAGVADSIGCGGACSAGFSAYIVDISGGSFGDVLRSAAISYGSYAAFSGINAKFESIKWGSYTNSQLAAKTLAHGAVGGVVADVSGGRFSDGFKTAASITLAKIGFERMREYTNSLKVKSSMQHRPDASSLKYNKWGELLTDGGRDIDYGYDSNGVQYTKAENNWITNGGMAAEGGEHLYSTDSVLGRSVNAVSKVHDTFNSWGYSQVTGNWVSYSEFYNTSFQIYSFAGMLPAAAYTAYAHAPISAVVLDEARRE